MSGSGAPFAGARSLGCVRQAPGPPESVLVQGPLGGTRLVEAWAVPLAQAGWKVVSSPTGENFDHKFIYPIG